MPGNRDRGIAAWTRRRDADLRRDGGEVLTAAWTFELELHGPSNFRSGEIYFNGAPAVGASTNFTAGPLG